MMLSSTVMCPNRARFWNVRPIPISARLLGVMPVTSWPLKKICPSVGLYRPEMQLTMEVLPAPLGPMIENSSPRSMLKLTSVSARTPPNLSDTCLASKMGVSAFTVRPPPNHYYWSYHLYGMTLAHHRAYLTL